jgi:hypothetical protein
MVSAMPMLPQRLLEWAKLASRDESKPIRLLQLVLSSEEVRAKLDTNSAEVFWLRTRHFFGN